MASSRQQFDSLLGGHSHLPSGVNVLHIISARAQEIEALTEAIDDPQRGGLVFQRLPKHMRRRIMSHNVKRMPRRLREAHLRQLEKSGLPPKTKRPSRKYRRRPSNLLQEYNRRQRKFIWLETHMWHAKRFHMIEKWGYKLPHYPNDKSFRACYRASANHCLLQDISYHCCIELYGPLEEIIEGLKQHTDKACGLTFAAKVYTSGSREGNITVFRKKSYPYGAIGNISFLWRPSKTVTSEGKDVVTNEEPEERILWLWIHPAFYEELCDELIDTFNFVESNMDITESVPSGCDLNVGRSDTSLGSFRHKRTASEKKVEMEKLASKIGFYSRTCKFESSSGHVKMNFLKDTLNRFRLTGPLSHSILQDALHVASMTVSPNKFPFVTKNLEKLVVETGTGNLNTRSVPVESAKDHFDKTMWIISSDEIMEVDEAAKDCRESGKSSDGEWWHDVCSGIYSSECVKIQNYLWETMKGAASPAQLPPNSVVALVVTDPRRYLPAKRMKCKADSDVMWPQESAGSWLQSLPPQSVFSPLWTATVRDAVTVSKPSAADIARSRSFNVVPVHVAEEQNIGDTSAILPSVEGLSWQKVPILLLQRPGSQDGTTKRLGFGSGWDIILPAGWAMPFWQALVFRGARVGGLREATSLSFEGLQDFGRAFLSPDTKSGVLEDTSIEKRLFEAHFRLPPDKRPNFATLGIVSPFKCSWDLLIKEWSDENDKNYLNEIFYVLRDKKKLRELECALDMNSRKKNHSFDNETCFDSDGYKKCLVPVCVSLKDKGIPSDFSIICVPTSEDLIKLSSCKSFPGPTEPLHEDNKKQERKQLQHNHKKKLKFLRKQRCAEKRKREDSNTAVVDGRENVYGTEKCEIHPATKAIVEQHAMKMRELWLPNVTTIRNLCSREVIGFIYKGGFSFSEGIGVGLGYIPLPALLSFIKTTYILKPWILVRNKNSPQYRYAMLQIHHVA